MAQHELYTPPTFDSFFMTVSSSDETVRTLGLPVGHQTWRQAPTRPGDRRPPDLETGAHQTWRRATTSPPEQPCLCYLEIQEDTAKEETNGVRPIV